MEVASIPLLNIQIMLLMGLTETTKTLKSSISLDIHLLKIVINQGELPLQRGKMKTLSKYYKKT
jgi:hypothetical protein